MASLGGALSLCLGMALIMLVELGELVVDLVSNLWSYANGKDVTRGREERRCEHCSHTCVKQQGRWVEFTFHGTRIGSLQKVAGFC